MRRVRRETRTANEPDFSCKAALTLRLKSGRIPPWAHSTEIYFTSASLWHPDFFGTRCRYGRVFLSGGGRCGYNQAPALNLVEPAKLVVLEGFLIARCAFAL
jgi:hypothetical protein